MSNNIRSKKTSTAQDLMDSSDRIKALLLKKESLKNKEISTDKKEAATKLPPCPKGTRIVPNGILRSALFGATGKVKRRYLEREEIPSIDGVKITYTGQRLDQGDLDTWDGLLYFLKDEPLGTTCRFTSYEFLKFMGFKDSGRHREVLESRIMRLCANVVSITVGQYTYFGSLVNGGAIDEKNKQWVVFLNPELKDLYAPKQFTTVDVEIRRHLSGQSLAGWLHGFYASHAKPYPIKIETIHKLCGSETAQLKHFTEKLKKALEQLKTAYATLKQTFDYEIKDGLLYVKKSLPPSQAAVLL